MKVCNLATTMQKKITCDYHVHIGQYCKAYYYASRVFSALKAFGTDELWFSSTTSCIYCKESAVACTDPAVYKAAPSARNLYTGVRSEIRDALNAAKELGIQEALRLHG